MESSVLEFTNEWRQSRVEYHLLIYRPESNINVDFAKQNVFHLGFCNGLSLCNG